MTPRPGRAALAAAAAVLAPLAAVLPAAAAGAAADDGVLVYAADDGGDGTHGLYWANGDGSDRHAVVADNDIRDVGYTALSPGGNRVAFEYDPTGSGVYGIAVANLDGSALRTLVPAPADTSDYVGLPAWSPDGGRLIYSTWTLDGDNRIASSMLRTVATTGKAVTADVPGGADLAYGSYRPGDASVIVAASKTKGIVLLSDGTVTSVPGTAGTVVTFPRLSPAGDRIAYTASNPGSASVRVMGVDGSSPVTLSGSAESPSWSPDGSRVYFARIDAAGDGDLAFAPADGSAPATVLVTGSDELAPWAAPRDTTAPGAPAGLAVRLAGTHPVVSWHNPGAPDISRYVVRRGSGTSPSSWSQVYKGGAGSFTDTVTAGQVYTYSVTAVDGMGNVSPAAERSMRALAAPATSAPGVVAYVATKPSFRVSWPGAGNPTGTRYVAGVSVHRPGSTSAWSTISDGTATSLVYAPPGTSAGASYHFRASARDAYGNASALVYSTATVPVDDRAASYSGTWAAATGQSNRWLSTLHTTRAAGAAATVRLGGTRYYVVGDRCPLCGEFRVYVNGSLKATVNAKASSYQYRRLLWTSAGMSLGTRTITIVNVATAGHAQLHLDAIAAVR